MSETTYAAPATLSDGGTFGQVAPNGFVRTWAHSRLPVGPLTRAQWERDGAFLYCDHAIVTRVLDGAERAT
jgi:hypothetical protein